MSTYLPPPIAMQQQPEEPPRFVECQGCGKSFDSGDALMYRDNYYCPNCTVCTCGQIVSAQCPSCDSWVCEACMMGEICGACAKQEDEIDTYREETDSDFAQFGGRGCGPQ